MWVRGYRRAWLGADLVAGAVASCVIVPQAIGYASLAGLPVQVGLYARWCRCPRACCSAARARSA